MSPRANPEQDNLVALPPSNVLVVAPAGCGKTEALARRARGLIERGDVTAPRKILAVTFSNKARDNLAARMRKWIGPLWYRRVEVVNLHKLAARIVRAHGKVLGIPTDFVVREDRWYRTQLTELGLVFQAVDAFETALRRAKDGMLSDDEVMQRLMESGHREAIAFERRLREAGRVDYDDLLRNAGRLLNVEAIRSLYRAHFAVTLADEIQDLSLVQFGIVQAVGGSTITYAGDIAQGIYGFAGAAPTEVFRRIQSTDPTIVELRLSYRSSPAVLNAVNLIARTMDTTLLECAEPDRWADGGRVEYLESENTEEEAAAILRRAKEILDGDSARSIGIIARRVRRLDHIRNALVPLGYDFEDWSLATHSTAVASLIKRHFRTLARGEVSDQDRLALLQSRCLEALDPSDIDTAREVVEACATLSDAVAEGVPLADAVEACRAVSHPTKAIITGIHLLSGHKGKGQEFDWVFVVGLEEGHIPDFRDPDDPEEQRLLHVMLSRAKYGLVFTRSRQVWGKRGWWTPDPSRWLNPLLESVTHK